MTHFQVLVAASDPMDALEPFRVTDGLPPFLRDCVCTRGPDDTFTHAPRATCRLCGGRGEHETDMSPIGRWDSFVTTTGAFRWLPGRRPMRARDDVVLTQVSCHW